MEKQTPRSFSNRISAESSLRAKLIPGDRATRQEVVAAITRPSDALGENPHDTGKILQWASQARNGRFSKLRITALFLLNLRRVTSSDRISSVARRCDRSDGNANRTHRYRSQIKAGSCDRLGRPRREPTRGWTAKLHDRSPRLLSIAQAVVQQVIYGDRYSKDL
jgi:hypothetical protein